MVLLAEHIRTHVPEANKPRWLFYGEGTNPPHQNSIGYLWRSTCKRGGAAGIRLHDLRHWFASYQIAAGCDVVTVQHALGHARATTTLNTYGHLFPSAEDRTREASQLAITLMLSPEAVAAVRD